MAESDISISEMTHGTFSAGAIFPAIQPDGQSSTGYSNVNLSGSDIGDGIGRLQFPLRLDTTDKTIFGAINEAANAYVNILPTDTATGSIASFPDGANNIPCPSVLCSINPVQSGSGDPSPSNVRPITGHTELNLVHTGKNLFDKTTVTDNAYCSGSTGEVTPTNGFICSDFIRVKEQIEYSTNSIASGVRIFVFYDKNKEYVGTTSSQTYVTPANTCYIRINAKKSDISVNEIQVVEGSSIGTYEDYISQTDTVSFSDTVYGGTLDVVSGVLTIDRAITDLGNYDWTRWTSGSSALFYNTIADKVNDRDNLLLCSCFNPSNQTATGLDNANGILTSDNSIVASKNTSAPRLIIRCNSYSDATAFKTAMTGQTVCYELATPTTTQLTPQEVKSLLGSNNIYHDCNGNISVTYKADIGLYIDKKTS